MNGLKLYRRLTGVAAMLALTMVTWAGSALAALPTVTILTPTNLGVNQVTLNLQSTRTGTSFFTLQKGSGVACGSAANVKAGLTAAATSTIAAYHGSLPLTANVTGLYTQRNLPQNSPYTVCFTNNSTVATPVTANFTTTTPKAPATPAWNYVGSSLGFLASNTSPTSLAFAPDGTPYVAYQVLTTNLANVKRYNRALTTPAWENVGNGGFSAAGAGYPSLAFAPDGTPYVAYRDVNAGGKATVMNFTGITVAVPTGWSPVGTAGFSPDLINQIVLAIAPDGAPYVAFRDLSLSGNVTVMKFTGITVAVPTGWSLVGSAGFSPGSVMELSLVFAPNGTPYVAYTDNSPSGNNKLTVMKFDGTAWVNVGLPDFSPSATSSTTLRSSLAIASDGTPYVAYADTSTTPPGMATVMKFDGTAWVKVGGAASTVATTATSLAFAPDGTLHVATQSPKATVSKFNTGTSTWETVGNVGFSTTAVSGSGTLAFAMDGTPYLAYAYGSIFIQRLINSTTTTLTSSLNPSNAGDSVTFTATVASAIAPGTVKFWEGQTQLGVDTTLASGVAATSTNALVAGTHSITANYYGYEVYIGADSYKASVTTALSQVVNAGKSPAVITFDTVPTPTYLGGDFTVHATTTNSDSTTLTYSKVSGPCTFGTGGTFSSTGAGTCVVQADGVATTNYKAASQTQDVTIAPATQTATVTSGPFSYDGTAKSVTVSCSGGGTATAITPATQTNAGSTAVTATCPATLNYNVGTGLAAGNFVINKITPTASVSNTPQNYTGSAQSATATCLGGGISSNITTGGSATQTNVGTYAVTADCAASTNYNAATTLAAGNFILGKITPTASVGNSPQNYTGSAQSATATCLGGGISSNITTGGSATQTNAGTYAVTVNCAASTNYNAATALAAGNFILGKITPTATVANSPQNYTGSAQSATVTCLGGGISSNITTGGSATQTNVGTYAVTADCAASTNYNAATALAAGNFILGKITPTVAVTGSTTFTYSGSPQGPDTATKGGSTGALTYSYSGAGYPAGATKPTSAGTYSVTATVAADTNYDSASSSATAFTINKVTPVVTVTAGTYTYSGSAQGPGATETTKGDSPGALTFSYLGTGTTTYSASTTKPTAAGTYSVTATVAADTNYAAASSDATAFTIGKASATVVLSNLARSYSGSALTPTAVTNPVGLTIDWTNAPQTNAGSYTVTATVNSSNYQGSIGGEFVITKVTPTLSITTTQQSYDGASHGATVTGSVAGSVTNITYNGIATVPFTAGTYAVTADFTPTNSSYNSLTGASAGNFTIDRAVPTLAVTNSPTTYTGAAKAAIVSGNVSGAVSNVKYDGSSAQPINAGGYKVTASFNPADSTNYGPLVNAPAGGFIIAKETPTLTVSNSPVSYDGLTHGATVTASVAGSVGGILTGGGLTQSAAGTYAVTANFIPADSINYNSLSNAPAGDFAILAASKVSVTVRTVPAGLTVTVDGGAAQIAPYTFMATPGSNHAIATTSPQGSVGTRYLFSAWSDKQGISHTITTPNTGSAAYTATFTTEYQLTTTVSPAGSGVVTLASNGWYAAGATPSIGVIEGSGYTFTSWSGPAANYASSATYVTMNGPITVTAIMNPVMTTLSAAMGAATGVTGATRSWPVILTPSAGVSAAAVQITGLTVSSSGSCKPVVTSAFPLALGNIAAGNSATGNVTVDFSSCSAVKQKTIKFNVTIGYSTNNGASTGSTSLTGVGQ